MRSGSSISAWKGRSAQPWSSASVPVTLIELLSQIVPHTTSLRNSQYEIAVEVAFLKPGAFLVQNVATYPNVRAIRKLGALKKQEFDAVFAGLLRWLGHTA